MLFLLITSNPRNRYVLYDAKHTAQGNAASDLNTLFHSDFSTGHEPWPLWAQQYTPILHTYAFNSRANFKANYPELFI